MYCCRKKRKIRGTKTHLIKKGYYEFIEQVYESAIISFYNRNPDIPNKILTTKLLSSSDVISRAILNKTKSRTRVISTPSKDIRPIFNLCKTNAKQVIANHLSKEDKYTYAINELKNILKIKEINRIESYDISHPSQDSCVASCVVFTKNGSSKKDYRLFNIPRDLAGNDIGSLEHALKRRLKYYTDNSVRPDLLLIDGGKNQLRFTENIN